MRRHATLTLLLCLSLLGGLLAGSSAAAAPVPADATWEQVWFPSKDGTMLRADLFLPKNREPDQRHPVILAIGPYFGRNALNTGVNANGPVLRFNDLITEGKIFANGYAYVQVDSRGFGGSDGCNDFGGRGEQMDTEAAVNWAAKQPWSNGRVGMWGKSYDAWTQVMALAEGAVGLKAAVIQAPLIETYRGMFMNGVHFDAGWYVTPSLYAAYDLAPNTPGDPEPEEYIYPAKGTATNPHCYAENIAFTPIPDRSLPYWRMRNIVDEAGRSSVPVIWSHGANDVNTKPHNFLDVYSRLEGPKRVWFGQWAHDRGNEVNRVGRDGFMAEAMDWFDHHLKGLPLVEHPNAEIQDNEGLWRAEDDWPPEDSIPHTFPLRAGSYADQRGNSAGSSGGSKLWTITPPVPYDLRIAGEPRLRVRVQTEVRAPEVNLIAIMYRVRGTTARMLSRGAYRASTGTVEFNLYPQDAILREGDRLGIVLAGDDSSHWFVHPTNSTVQVTEGSITLGFLRYVREINLAGGPPASSIMNSVPQFTVGSDTISASEIDVTWPPKPIRRCEDEPEGCHGEE